MTEKLTAEEELFRKGAAYHEAGHAVLAFWAGMPVVDVSIVSGPGYGGVTRTEDQHPIFLQQIGAFYEGTKQRDHYVCHHVMRVLAGEVAQRLFCPESVEPEHAEQDRKTVEVFIKGWDRYASQAELDGKVEELERCTEELLMKPPLAAATEALAQALLERNQLSREEVYGIIEHAMKQATPAGEEPDDLECPHCVEYDRFWGEEECRE